MREGLQLLFSVWLKLTLKRKMPSRIVAISSVITLWHMCAGFAGEPSSLFACV